MSDLQGKRIVVTGAASGFGAEISRRAVARSARVFMMDLDQDKGKGLQEELDSSGERCLFMRADVTSEGDWLAARDRVIEAWGGVDAVINNAGWSHPNKSTLSVTSEEFDKLININLKSIFYSVQAFVPIMLDAKTKGSFVNIGSVTSMRPRPGLSWYAASKAAVAGATMALAVDYASNGIRFNTISPTLSETGLTSTFTGVPSTAENNAKWVATIPMGRIGQPEDIAEGTLFLVSDQSSFITGVNLPVDGGRHI